MNDTFVCLNGELTPADEAAVSVFDTGFLHAAGLFETVRIVNGTPFRLPQHLARLEATSKALHINLPADRASWPLDIARLLERNGLTDARVRLTVTAGSLAAPSDSTDSFSGTVLITAGPAVAYPREQYELGMTVCISSFLVSPTDPTAGHKTLCYLPRLLALREARERHCAEALWFTTQHRLAEACHSNVMLVRDGVLCTPPLDTPVLNGITRAAVLQIAREHSIEIREAPLTIEELLTAQEVALTNAMMGIMPVTHIERHTVCDGTPGPITRRLMAAYQACVEKETSVR